MFGDHTWSSGLPTPGTRHGFGWRWTCPPAAVDATDAASVARSASAVTLNRRVRGRGMIEIVPAMYCDPANDLDTPVRRETMTAGASSRPILSAPELQLLLQALE